MNIPPRVLDFWWTKTTEELRSHLWLLELLHANLPELNLWLAIKILEQIIETKSQCKYFLFYWEDGGIHGDSYLPDGFLLYQQLWERLIPILPSPLRPEYDPVRVVENIQEIIDYLLQVWVKTVYTFKWDRNFPSLSNSNEHHWLSIWKPSDSTQGRFTADELEKNDIRIIEQN